MERSGRRPVGQRIELVIGAPRGRGDEVTETPYTTPEQEILQSELEYRSLVKTLPHAVTIIQDGRIAFANRAAAEALGFDDDQELVGRDPLEFVAQHERSRVGDFLQRRLSGESGVPEQYETVIRTRDGDQLPAEIRAKTFFFRGRIASQLAATDISDRRKSETYMRLFMEALQQVNEGIAFFGLDDRLAFCNRSFASLLGYLVEELEGSHLADLVPTEELLSLASANEETLRVGQHDGHLFHLRKDGSRFYAIRTSTLAKDDQGAPLGMILTIRDMSEINVVQNLSKSGREKLSRRYAELEKQLLETSEQLGACQAELENYAKRLEQNKEALRLVMGENENRNQDRERLVCRNVRSTVTPIVEQLKTERLPDSARLLLDSLEFNLKSIFSSVERNGPERGALLTPQETRLCEMIRAGLTSKQMAEVLGISPATVVIHRAHIRKKLGLVGSDDNLATYLRSEF
jgi:PAS domain S-box-containing protein